MINSHKELIEEIRDFCSKFDLIKNFSYIKDIDAIEDEISNSQERTLAIGIDSISFDDENYNMTIDYIYAIAERTLDNTDSIINSETENIFCLSALSDYLKHLSSTHISIEDAVMSNSSDRESIFTTTSGKFSFIVKRNPSFWKIMEGYSNV